LLEAATRHAESNGYLGHEFGDTSLVLAAPESWRSPAAPPFRFSQAVGCGP
jgi:hypothetical protein